MAFGSNKASYDIYYYSVRKKVRLTGLGHYILENIIPRWIAL